MPRKPGSADQRGRPADLRRTRRSEPGAPATGGTDICAGTRDLPRVSTRADFASVRGASESDPTDSVTRPGFTAC